MGKNKKINWAKWVKEIKEGGKRWNEGLNKSNEALKKYKANG